MLIASANQHTSLKDRQMDRKVDDCEVIPMCHIASTGDSLTFVSEKSAYVWKQKEVSTNIWLSLYSHPMDF